MLQISGGIIPAREKKFNSSIKSKTSSHAWLPQKNEKPRRPQRDPAAAPKRKKTADGLLIGGSPAMERWLSLTVSEGKNPDMSATRGLFFISVPKKVVNKAVRRNRIKRVLREALRHEVQLPAGKVHVFRVMRAPEGVDLKMAKQVVHELLHYWPTENQ